jgi:hypothetical protein
MIGFSAELRGFIFAHSHCAGARRADLHHPLHSLTPDGYRLLLKCGCGVEFTRWVVREDADDDLLRSALLAFEN